MRRHSRYAAKKHHRTLCCESLENRRMLATMADIVFLVDESESEEQLPTRDWLRYVVTGDFDPADGSTVHPDDTTSLAERLDLAGIDDVRYGLVGLGEDNLNNTQRFARSQLFPQDDPTPNPFDPSFGLFGDPTLPAIDPDVDYVDTTELNAVFGPNLAQLGGIDDVQYGLVGLRA